MADQITDPFFSKLYARLEEESDKRINSLANGSALAGDAFNTSAKYQEQVSYLQAIKDIIELCYELDREIYGVRSKRNTEES